MATVESRDALGQLAPSMRGAASIAQSRASTMTSTTDFNIRHKHKSVVGEGPVKAPAPALSAAAANLPKTAACAKPGDIRPPDRQQEMLMEKTHRRMSHGPNAAPLPFTFPEKSRRTSLAAKSPRMSLSLVSAGSAAGGSVSSRSGVQPPLVERSKSSDGTARRSLPAIMFQKKDKSEVAEYYKHLKSIEKFIQSNSGSQYFGSLSSRGSNSTLPSTVSSSLSLTPGVMAALKSGAPEPSNLMEGELGRASWQLRWKISENGRQAGQVRYIRDIAVLRNGHLAVTEGKNSRIQIFNNVGKSVASFGDSSDNARIAQSFFSPSGRKMEPTGLCELNVESNILAVTDLNRLLYVDASVQGGLQDEIVMKGKTHMHGIATTQTGKLIICEVGTQPSVGLYEPTGRVVKEFRGDFKRPAYVAYSDEFDVCAVADSEQHCVRLYDLNGHYLNQFGQRTTATNGHDDSVLVYPTGLCWLPDGKLLVADRASRRVMLFDLRNFAVETVLSAAEHGLQEPIALASNRRNRIIVSEEMIDFGSSKFHLKMFKYARLNGNNGTES